MLHFKVEWAMFYRYSARVLDVLIVLVSLPVVIPTILFFSLLIYIDDPGSVIFSQRRLGKNKKIFYMYKLRKFRCNESSNGRAVTLSNDSRFTKVGRIIEKFKIDELPQFYNILVGDMSFVGPRPITMFFADEYENLYYDLFKFRPGVFGPNQVKYRNEGKILAQQKNPEKYYRDFLIKDKAERDILFFSNAGLYDYISILLKGIFAVIFSSLDSTNNCNIP